MERDPLRCLVHWRMRRGRHVRVTCRSVRLTVYGCIGDWARRTPLQTENDFVANQRGDLASKDMVSDLDEWRGSIHPL